jgi:hypothetical protein
MIRCREQHVELLDDMETVLRNVRYEPSVFEIRVSRIHREEIMRLDELQSNFGRCDENTTAGDTAPGRKVWALIESQGDWAAMFNFINHAFDHAVLAWHRFLKEAEASFFEAKRDVSETNISLDVVNGEFDDPGEYEWDVGEESQE